MAVNREAIFAALFARLAGLADPALAGGLLFRYATRIYEGWDETAPSQKPALQLRKGPETPTPRRGLPSLWTLSAGVIVYATADDAREVPASTQLNQLLTAIEGALERKPTDGPIAGAIFPNNPDLVFGTTLGGLCYSCQIVPSVEVFEAGIDQDLLAIVPLEILTTA